MAEFALTLPILLLLMFGVIEFARIFQAWLTLQNAARTAARYAITGQWDPDSFADVMGVSFTPGTTEEQKRQLILDMLVPCTAGYDRTFADHWGRDCDPTDEEDLWLRLDMARLPSIVDRAERSVGSLSVQEGQRYVGLFDSSGSELNTETVGEDDPGWFHVWICSSRPPIINSALPSRYRPGEDRNDRLCELREGNVGANQYDAGGPGDAVEVIVFFNHPLITPIPMVDQIQLQARRVMINESFRSSRIVNLPPQLIQATFTPSNTPRPTDTPTNTPSRTPTASKTPKPTNTLTSTFTVTPTPLCTGLSITSATLVNNYIQVRVLNTNFAPVFISAADVRWTKPILYPGMYTNEMLMVGKSAFWNGTDYDPNTTVDSTVSGWQSDATRRQLNGGSATSVWQMKFVNGPAMLSSFYTVGSFGVTLYFSPTWQGTSRDCTLVLSGYPTPTPFVPTNTPVPRCEDNLVAFVGFETSAVVHYTVTNNGTAMSYLSGFNLIWNAYGRSLTTINLDMIGVGGTSAFNADTIIIWNGSDNSSPATGASGGTSWIVNAAIVPGARVDIWIDFDNVSDRLDANGYFSSDFNGTTFTFNTPGCTRSAPPIATPVNTPVPPTNTPKPPSNTPTRTNTPGTPTKTNTPTSTRTPTPVTPTKTLTPTATNTPYIFGGE